VTALKVDQPEGEPPTADPAPTRKPSWSDPFAIEGVRDDRARLRLSFGALEGARAELVVGPRSIPRLWALTDELVVTVSGDLTRAELLQAAESLRPATDVAP
jgi:hypothetical protein